MASVLGGLIRRVAIR